MIANKTCDFCEKNETKIDFFLIQLKAHILILKKVTNHLVVDDFYAKQKLINGSIDYHMQQEVISVFSDKQHRYNQFFIDSVLSNLGRNPKFYKNQNWYIAIKNLGAISA